MRVHRPFGHALHLLWSVAAFLTSALYLRFDAAHRCLVFKAPNFDTTQVPVSICYDVDSPARSTCISAVL